MPSRQTFPSFRAVVAEHKPTTTMQNGREEWTHVQPPQPSLNHQGSSYQFHPPLPSTVANLAGQSVQQYYTQPPPYPLTHPGLNTSFSSSHPHPQQPQAFFHPTATNPSSPRNHHTQPIHPMHEPHTIPIGQGGAVSPYAPTGNNPTSNGNFPSRITTPTIGHDQDQAYSPQSSPSSNYNNYEDDQYPNTCTEQGHAVRGITKQTHHSFIAKKQVNFSNGQLAIQFRMGKEKPISEANQRSTSKNNRRSTYLELDAPLIKSVLDLPQNLAAKKLGVSVSTLKRRFTALRDEIGLDKWPYHLGKGSLCTVTTTSTSSLIRPEDEEDGSDDVEEKGRPSPSKKEVKPQNKMSLSFILN